MLRTTPPRAQVSTFRNTRLGDGLQEVSECASGACSAGQLCARQRRADDMTADICRFRNHHLGHPPRSHPYQYR